MFDMGINIINKGIWYSGMILALGAQKLLWFLYSALCNEVITKSIKLFLNLQGRRLWVVVLFMMPSTQIYQFFKSEWVQIAQLFILVHLTWHIIKYLIL